MVRPGSLAIAAKFKVNIVNSNWLVIVFIAICSFDLPAIAGEPGSTIRLFVPNISMDIEPNGAYI